MLRALYSAASGMQSQQMNLDVISNNLANTNTTGYKMTKLQFQDLLYQNTREAGSQQGGGNQLPSSLQIGQGSVPVAPPSRRAPSGCLRMSQRQPCPAMALSRVSQREPLPSRPPTQVPPLRRRLLSPFRKTVLPRSASAPWQTGVSRITGQSRAEQRD